MRPDPNSRDHKRTYHAEHDPAEVEQGTDSVAAGRPHHLMIRPPCDVGRKPRKNELMRVPGTSLVRS